MCILHSLHRLQKQTMLHNTCQFMVRMVFPNADSPLTATSSPLSELPKESEVKEELNKSMPHCRKGLHIHFIQTEDTFVHSIVRPRLLLIISPCVCFNRW